MANYRRSYSKSARRSSGRVRSSSRRSSGYRRNSRYSGNSRGREVRIVIEQPNASAGISASDLGNIKVSNLNKKAMF